MAVVAAHQGGRLPVLGDGPKLLQRPSVGPPACGRPNAGSGAGSRLGTVHSEAGLQFATRGHTVGRPWAEEAGQKGDGSMAGAGACSPPWPGRISCHSAGTHIGGAAVCRGPWLCTFPSWRRASRASGLSPGLGASTDTRDLPGSPSRSAAGAHARRQVPGTRAVAVVMPRGLAAFLLGLLVAGFGSPPEAAGQVR